MEEGERVLIVAGSERLRHALKALLEAAPGLRVKPEICREKTLKGDGFSRASVVLLAGGMSGMNLLQAIGHIQERWPETRLLVLAEDAAQWREAKAAGADRVHFKGIAPEKLVRAVRWLLQEG